jgi:hypothetical protein
MCISLVLCCSLLRLLLLFVPEILLTLSETRLLHSVGWCGGGVYVCVAHSGTTTCTTKQVVYRAWGLRVLGTKTHMQILSWGLLLQ